MSGEIELAKLLSNMSPELLDGEYVFCHLGSMKLDATCYLNPIAIFQEPEGMSVVIKKEIAVAEKIELSDSFRCITLKVHSSLNAVGLTAAIAAKLTEEGISANVIAAFYHDHVFVPASHADRALACLVELSN